MAAAFSRLQLAAALIEYDNNDEDPSAPRRSAQTSAIFLPFRNRPLRPPAERKSTDYLGVSLPTETGSIAPRDSVAFDRRSRASVDALRNPFGRDSTYDGALEEEEEDEIEVDLASWGLDSIMPKEKEKSKRKRNKSEAPSELALPNPHDNVSRVEPALPNPHDSFGRTARPAHVRTLSGNMLNGLGEGGAFLDSVHASSGLGPRRHSIGDPLDAPEAHSSEPLFPPRSRSPSAHALIDRIASPAPLHAIPFPSSESVRSPSPRGDERRRTLSIGSRTMLHDEPRSFSPDRASRYELASARGRTYSSGSMGKMLNDPVPEEDNPFAVRPPSPSRMSRFDPKAQRARTLSHGTLATQMMLDDEPERPDTAARPSMGERRYSRLDLMRPKVLIMPTPLQNIPTSTSQPSLQAREGFELSTDGRPLPPGARASRRASSTLSVLEPGLLAAPATSSAFTPNPRQSLTLSQLVFRNTLMVDGQRDIAYADIEGHLKRATEDGERIEMEPEPEPEPEPEIPIVAVEEEPTGPKRPAGKLYGRSLIDDLEARKAEMRGKQRVFRGDDRPSMMARSQTQRSSTLIAPDELKRPQSQHMNSFHSQPELTRRNSVNAKPLLDFDDEIPGAPRTSLHPGGGLTAANKSRSVFGVDTIWERELAKLKVIEERERQEEEERKKREAVEEAKSKKNKKKKGKGKEREVAPEPATPPTNTPSPGQVEESTPPVLPAIARATVRRAPPPPGDGESSDDDDSDSSDAPTRPRAQASGWHSDEDEGSRKTTGVGPRYPSNAGGPPRLPQISRDHDDESSEEDVPLVATIGRAAQRQARSRLGDESSDEEKPLSALLDKTKSKLPSLGSFGDIGGSLSPHSAAPGGDDEDEDEKPLGLRASRFGLSLNPSSVGGEDEDDKPLGLHPEQMRKSQFFMAQAQQQQQQQMFAQAQMAQMAAQQSMIFGAPSMMGSGFFPPPMAAPPMMMYPQLPPTPPPMQDAVKFGRVDKWRHDVAVEGERS